MAWIKLRTDLHDDPAVIYIANKLEIDLDSVVGKLARIWSWANEQTRDGNALGVTFVTVDRYAGVTGFAHAMMAVGWLEPLLAGDKGEIEGIRFPNFDVHNGQSAKSRLLTAKRAEKLRTANIVTKVTVEAHQEKRREELGGVVGGGEAVQELLTRNGVFEETAIELAQHTTLEEAQAAVKTIVNRAGVKSRPGAITKLLQRKINGNHNRPPTH